MIRSLYTSGWSLMSQNRALDVSSNNMANANTTGYKKDTVVYESFPDVLTTRINDTNTSSSPTGKVGKIAKAVGDTVKRGEKLLQVESAKGNTIIKSTVNGTITAFAVTEGARVKVGDELLEIEKAE